LEGETGRAGVHGKFQRKRHCAGDPKVQLHGPKEKGGREIFEPLRHGWRKKGDDLKRKEEVPLLVGILVKVWGKNRTRDGGLKGKGLFSKNKTVRGEVGIKRGQRKNPSNEAHG